MLWDFKAHLIQKALIEEKYVPFYQEWVSDCYSFLNVSDTHILNLDQKNRFLKHLTRVLYTHVASKNILGVRSPLDK